MEFLKNIFLFCFRLFKKVSKKNLNLIEDTRDITYKKLLDQKIFNPTYIIRINILETKLKKYSPFTLMTYSILLFIIFIQLTKYLKKSYNILKNISIKQIKEYFILLVLKLPKYKSQLNKAKRRFKK